MGGKTRLEKVAITVSIRRTAQAAGVEGVPEKQRTELCDTHCSVVILLLLATHAGRTFPGVKPVVGRKRLGQQLEHLPRTLDRDHGVAFGRYVCRQARLLEFSYHTYTVQVQRRTVRSSAVCEKETVFVERGGSTSKRRTGCSNPSRFSLLVHLDLRQLLKLVVDPFTNAKMSQLMASSR